MNFRIKHETKKRMRFHVMENRMSFAQADTLLYFLHMQKQVSFVKIYERTGDVVLEYTGEREEIIHLLRAFRYEDVEIPIGLLESSGRETNAIYQERLIGRIMAHYLVKWTLPLPLRTLLILAKSSLYIYRGVRTLLKRKLEVPVLDGIAIGASIVRNDINTAGSIMFLLGVGELLEEWTHKKSVNDLARSLSLNIGNVWKKSRDDIETLVPASSIEMGDSIVVHMGNVIPFDGTVSEGEAMVNQASLTGEAVPVRKIKETTVYAGTVVEEGELTIRVKEIRGASRFEKIVSMMEETEKMKSSMESKAEHLADRLVPYSLAATALTYLLTRNVTKAISILMVDFSCALKLAMPISVLSAIREASLYNITVKGGRYLETIAEADTIVFDKTGTLTKARPTVAEVISFNGVEPDELLRIAACMEEHFPHSMAKAVVDAAKERQLNHEEMHSKVEYLVAHGIRTTIGNKRAVIGSYHFVVEDEGVELTDEARRRMSELPTEYSHLYLAIDYRLEAVICIEDPLRDEAAAVIQSLRMTGISKIVMMTGDSERTAAAIARRVGVDEYFSEVLPEDKAGYIEKEKAKGRKVVMIGDGINDSPALSAADVGIAISDGAEIAREIADITVNSDDLYQLVTLRLLGTSLVKRISRNYRRIVGFNSGLIVLGVAGVIQPATSALLHNGSTLLIGLQSMNNLLD